MEQRDYIDEIILKNLEKLNDFEPQEGHFERFESKLKLQQQKKKVNLNMVLKIAAAVVFVLLASNQAFIYFSPGDHNSLLSVFEQKEVTLASVSPEYKEVEFYYTSSINVGLTQWNELAKEGFVSGEEQNVMNTELQDFEELYKNLQKDLTANPHDERVINAMLEYYQTKLSVINIIVNKLEEVKQQTNKNHEIEM